MGTEWVERIIAFRVAVTGITTGKLVDMGTKDSMNMVLPWHRQAWNTICQNFE